MQQVFLEKSLLLLSTISLLLLVVGSFRLEQLSPLSSNYLDCVKDHKEQYHQDHFCPSTDTS